MGHHVSNLHPPGILPLIEWCARGPDAGVYPELLKGSTAMAEALAFVLGNGLAAPAGANLFALTGRGQAFLGMLLSAPLPEQIWADPRFVVGEGPTIYQHRQVQAGPLLTALTPTAPVEIKTAVDSAGDDEAGNIPADVLARAAAAVQKGPAAWTEQKLPDDFTEHVGTRPQHLPEGVLYNSKVHVFRRDGRIEELHAASINWKRRNKRDDVLGFQHLVSDDEALEAKLRGRN